MLKQNLKAWMVSHNAAYTEERDVLNKQKALESAKEEGMLNEE